MLEPDRVLVVHQRAAAGLTPPGHAPPTLRSAPQQDLDGAAVAELIEKTSGSVRTEKPWLAWARARERGSSSSSVVFSRQVLARQGSGSHRRAVMGRRKPASSLARASTPGVC